MKRTLSILLCLGVFSSTVATARNAAPPRSMAALGDSITAGCLANFKPSNIFNPFKILELNYHLGMTALKFGHLSGFDRDDLSWSTGFGTLSSPLTINGDVFAEPRIRRYPVKSHLYRLKKQNPKIDIRSRNFSLSNAKTENVLNKQIWKMHKWSRRTLKQNFPDYVTLFAGNNDLCAERFKDITPISIFEDQMRESIETMLIHSPNTKVLVVAIPRINKLPDIVGDMAYINLGKKKFMTCNQFWKHIQFCPVINSPKSEKIKQMTAQKIVEYNQTMRTITEDYQQRFGDRIRFADEMFNHDFEKEDISVDCFHPNIRGQNKIADSTWQQSWWAE